MDINEAIIVLDTIVNDYENMLDRETQNTPHKIMALSALADGKEALNVLVKFARGNNVITIADIVADIIQTIQKSPKKEFTKEGILLASDNPLFYVNNRDVDAAFGHIKVHKDKFHITIIETDFATIYKYNEVIEGQKKGGVGKALALFDDIIAVIKSLPSKELTRTEIKFYSKNPDLYDDAAMVDKMFKYIERYANFLSIQVKRYNNGTMEPWNHTTKQYKMMK